MSRIYPTNNQANELVEFIGSQKNNDYYDDYYDDYDFYDDDFLDQGSLDE